MADRSLLISEMYLLRDQPSAEVLLSPGHHDQTDSATVRQKLQPQLLFQRSRTICALTLFYNPALYSGSDTSLSGNSAGLSLSLPLAIKIGPEAKFCGLSAGAHGLPASSGRQHHSADLQPGLPLSVANPPPPGKRKTAEPDPDGNMSSADSAEPLLLREEEADAAAAGMQLLQQTLYFKSVVLLNLMRCEEQSTLNQVSEEGAVPVLIRHV